MQNNEKNLKQRAYTYSINSIQLIDTLNKTSISSQVIAKQLMRSATSVGANIIEAQAGSTRKDFTNFFSYALKSANESKFWLELLRDTGKANKDKIELLVKETDELSRMLGASIITLRKKN